MHADRNGVLLNGLANYHPGVLPAGINGTPISGGGVIGNGHMHGAILKPQPGSEPTLLDIDLNIAETCEDSDGESVRTTHFAGVITST